MIYVDTDVLVHFLIPQDNDCLHTAIAERHCDELYTFNKSEFKKIARLSKLKGSFWNSKHNFYALFALPATTAAFCQM